MLLGMTIFLVFPFTRLVHIWSAPVWYLGRVRYQIVRTRRSLASVEPDRIARARKRRRGARSGATKVAARFET